jgi:hypothetical protein
MSPAKILYHWSQKVSKVFTSLTKPEALVLALFSLGLARAQHCTLTKVAEQLEPAGKADTVERRLQRFLGNAKVHWQSGCQNLAGWVLSNLVFSGRTVVLLVDETALAEHLRVMAVSLAYRGRAIPLAWWCYPQERHPMKQARLINTLFGWIAPHIRPGYEVLVQADRGIGTSPGLLHCIRERGWHFLVRVQGSVRIIPEGRKRSVPFRSLISRPGQQWSGWVKAFKKAGWRRCWAIAFWGRGYQEPWLLLSDWELVRGPAYGWRMWEELAFRDFKSYGWNWQKSHVWDPTHANRLWLVMALAYAWVLSLGTQAAHLLTVRREVARGRQLRHSLFVLGVRVLHRARELFKELFRRFDFIFIPYGEPTQKSVV